MIEIRYHGRGGQGAVIASKILAEAAFREDNYVQSFPYFGVERRGAPVTAFTRIGKDPIRVRSEIYNPDFIVILDEALLKQVDMFYGVKETSSVLVNTSLPPDKLDVGHNIRKATVDATSIAIKHRLGSKNFPIVNTSIIGALAKVTGLVSIDSVGAAIRKVSPAKQEENELAAREAYESVVIGGE